MDGVRIVEHMLKFLREQRMLVAERVNNDECKDFTEYKYLMGIYRGLNYADEEIARIVKKAGELDD